MWTRIKMTRLSDTFFRNDLREAAEGDDVE